MRNVNREAVLAVAMAFIAPLALAHEGEHPRLDEGDNTLVQSVIPDSPAAAAGLQAGDRLVRLADQEFKTQEDLERILAAQQPGDTVPLVVERDGETIELELTFGERPGGGVFIGMAYAVLQASAVPPGEGLTREQCLTWVDSTYRVEDWVRELKLEPIVGQEATQELRTCVVNDLQRMPSPMPQEWCDNVFKAHCSGLDLLTEIGEALIERCAEWIGEPLDFCAGQKIYDRYTREGEASDETACRAARTACAEAG